MSSTHVSPPNVVRRGPAEAPLQCVDPHPFSPRDKALGIIGVSVSLWLFIFMLVRMAFS